MEIYATDFEVDYKGDDSPLTMADQSANTVINGYLTPTDIPIISEENKQTDYAVRKDWSRCWIVDPLDGTKEFVNRNGEFTVNIALISNHEPILGVVYVPVTGACYSGVVGHCAFLQMNNGPENPVSVRKPHARPIIVVGSRSHANPKLESHLAALGDYELVSMGSSLKFCLVAEGKADFYPRLGPTSEWDTGAAQAVVVAAGGQMTHLDGSAFQYNCKESLLNPEFLVFGDSSVNWSSFFQD